MVSLVHVRTPFLHLKGMAAPSQLELSTSNTRYNALFLTKT
uniref:Uncharacterized protein n=1 Tax=Anguilla anguilla TaxID=7936 RepID=A0A0E9SH19_ANGAN